MRRCGKTIVSSAIIDPRELVKLGRQLVETPVGFKWFVTRSRRWLVRLRRQESAGASFLRRGRHGVTTDKDGLILGLLAAEITRGDEGNPSQRFEKLTAEFGTPYYERIDAAATPEPEERAEEGRAGQIDMTELAGDAVTKTESKAAGNDQSFGGIKVSTANGWFAARPSGTEDVYKIYAREFPQRGSSQADSKRRAGGDPARCLPNSSHATHTRRSGARAHARAGTSMVFGAIKCHRMRFRASRAQTGERLCSFEQYVSQCPLVRHRSSRCSTIDIASDGDIADHAQQDHAGEQIRPNETRAPRAAPSGRGRRGPARISQTTARISDTVRLSRMPEMMSGLADGRAILKITARRDICSERATS